jgi:ornithine cyclodeaminase
MTRGLSGSPRQFDAAAVGAALSWTAAVAALRAALTGGLDPERVPARSSLGVPAGELLMMPAGDSHWVGVKLVSVAPENPAISLPRVQGVYVLFDAATLTPRAVLDGAALTSLRTPAVSALALDLTATPDSSRLAIFGTGPQAYGHVQAIRAVRPIRQVAVVARDPGRTAAFVRRLVGEGIDAVVADRSAVADADIVACCTTASQPVFEGTMLGAHAVVLACGSHTPDTREVDAATARRGPILVESRSAALAEAGDVIAAIAEGACGADDLVTLADLVTGRSDRRPALIKTVGMGWEDLVIAAAVVQAA